MAVSSKSEAEVATMAGEGKEISSDKEIRGLDGTRNGPAEGQPPIE
jgi:hypothetical protein